jgi:uncharacterized protein (TIGR02391 family)
LRSDSQKKQESSNSSRSSFYHIDEQIMSVPSIESGVLESLCKILGHTNSGLSGTEIGVLLNACRIDDVDSTSSKRHRLFNALNQRQMQDRCANNVVAFVQQAMNPVRYVGRTDYFEDQRSAINEVIAFAGLELRENGQIAIIQRATTLSEAAQRANELRLILRERNVHLDVLQSCREELLVNNYFHAVFEATKSVAEKIRQRTGLTTDGAALIDTAFTFKNQIPHLALNSLQNESEKSEQIGFMNLLKGLFGTFRNTTAHAPKITWPIDKRDALDILSLVSLVHRRIDNSVDARQVIEKANGQ